MSPKEKRSQDLLAPGSNGYYWLMVTACVGAAVLFRVAFLSADPPWHFTWSQALFTDGARAIDGARSKIAFGTWIPDMRSPVVLFYPLVNLIAYLVFKVGGIGLTQANLTGVLPALAAIGLIFADMRKLGGHGAGLIALVALAFCYVHIVYSRVPMVESLLILMLLVAFFQALKGYLGLFVSGLVVGLASFMVKMHAIHLVPVILVYLWMGRGSSEHREPKRLSLALSFAAGFAVAVGLWFAFVYSVSPEMVAKYFRSNILISQKSEYAGGGLLRIISRRIGAWIHVGSGRDGYFASAPVISILAYLGLGSVLSRFAGGRAIAQRWERLAALWFVGLASALSLLSYRPLRYMILLTPSAILLATSFLLRLAQGRPLLSGRKPRWFIYVFPIWLAWVLIHLQHDIIFRFLSGGQALIGGDLTPSQITLYRFHLSDWSHVFIFGGVSVGITLILKRRILDGKIAPSRRTAKRVLIAALVALVLLNTAKFAGFTHDRRYTILDNARSLKRTLSHGAFLVGDCSTTLSLEAGFKTLPAYGDLIRYDERQQFEQYPVTHLLLRFPTLYEYLNKIYPDFAKQVLPVRSFVLCGREATVVRYPEWPGYPEASYVPSDYEIGMERLIAGQPEQACRLLEGFVEKSPGSFEGFTALAICHLRSGQVDQAQAAVKRALELTRRDALSYEIYGDILSSLGRDREARGQWAKALKLNPYSRSLQNKLGSRRR